MKKSLRWVAVAAAAAATAATLTGCVLTSSGDDSDGTAAAQTLNVVVTGYSDATKANWEDVIKGFEAQSTDITIALDVQPPDSVNDVIKARIQAGQQPDILNVDLNAGTLAGVAAGDLLYPASAVVSQKTLDDFLPRFADDSKLNGTQYGLPFAATLRALFYNIAAFKKAGIKGAPKTWATFEADAAKLKASGITPYGMPLGSEEAEAEAAVWFYGNGGGYGDERTLTIDSPQNIGGATEMQKIIEKGWTEQNPGSTDFTPLLNVFIQGKIGMQVGPAGAVGMIKEQNPGLKYAVAPIPAKAGTPFTLGAADQLVAFKNKTDKTAAITKFLNYVYQSDVYTKWLTSEGFLPTTASASEAMASDKGLKPFLDLLPDAKFYPWANPDWPTAQDALRTQLGQLGDGAKPTDLLAQIQASATGE